MQGGELRVGVSADPPWTEVAAPGATEPAVTGIEPTLVADFARALDAEVVWTVGGEESLVGDLADGRLDLVIGGLTEASPWTEQVALTRPYVTVPDAVGDAEPHVMAARMGENAFLVELETFLLAHDVPEVGS
ncbi:transporter substrate-binding domain-containing protein [Puerhibacterium sp. TATVAM-FAB25]|uniref:transporter substrate-binding domain-containing protein n=1 Tax=Puerhibacterium sp. TATVAM-FAB25 TaxID=3093699 RepID=UPI0039793FE4